MGNSIRLALLALVSVCWTNILGAAEPDTLRLEKDVVPTAQQINLSIDPRDSLYHGSTEIQLAVNSTTGRFRFHAEDMIFDSVYINTGTGRVGVQLTPGPMGLITAACQEPLQAGRDCELVVYFTNNFGSQGTGLFKLEHEGNLYAATQHEAIDARESYPCFDEPEFRIPFEIQLTVPQQYFAVSGMPVADESVTGDYKTIIFEPTPALPSYLTAIVVGPFDTVGIPGTSIPCRMICPKGMLELGSYFAGHVAASLGALEEYFGSTYPFPKLDLIAIPPGSAAGGMENPGAIIFDFSFALLDSTTASFESKRRSLWMLVHELGHAWCGDLVSMKWWDDLWLNESFATWIQAKVSDKLWPEFEFDLRSLGSAQWAMTNDENLSTSSMHRSVSASSDPWLEADVVNYDKGAAVLQMLEFWLGEDLMQATVRQFLQQHAMGSATREDFLAVLPKEPDLSSAMMSYIDQPGVPLVEISGIDGNNITIRQRRFLAFGLTDTVPRLWHIPMVISYFDGDSVRTVRTIITESVQQLQLATEKPLVWIHPNAGEYGYYRWLVPPAMLQRLTDSSGAILSVRERIMLADNLLALFGGGLVPSDQYLASLEVLAHDSRPEVIDAVVAGCQSLHSEYIKYMPELAPQYRQYVLRLLAPAMGQLGFARRPGETEKTASTRRMVLDVAGRLCAHRQVLAWADSTAHAFMADPASVDPNLGGAALRIAACYGDLALFEQLKRLHQACVNPAEREQYLYALAGFDDSAAVSAVLRYTLSDSLLAYEGLGLLGIMIWNSPTRQEDRVIEWVAQHYDQLTKEFSPTNQAYLAWFAQGESMVRLERMRAILLDPARNIPAAETELAKVEESIRIRIARLERDAEPLRAYLIAHTAAQ